MLAEIGKYAEAEALMRESLAIRRKVLPPTHPQVADLIGVVAGVVQDQNRLDEAEKLYLEALRFTPTWPPCLARVRPPRWT